MHYNRVPVTGGQCSRLHRMLYDFYKSQNDRKPGTIHATYMVYGVAKSTAQQQDGDVEMTDSQPSEDGHGPYSDQVLTQTLSLVKEEQLQGK